MRLATGLCPYPLGELERFPRPSAAIGVGVLLTKGKGVKYRGRESEGEGKKGEEGKEKGYLLFI